MAKEPYREPGTVDQTDLEIARVKAAEETKRHTAEQRTARWDSFISLVKSEGGGYLWGWLRGGTRYDLYTQHYPTRGEPDPIPDWGTQDGATRYKSRIQAVRDAKKAHGRVVRLTGWRHD